MAVTINDPTTDPVLATDGQSINPFKAVTVTDTAPLSSTESVTISLAQTGTTASGTTFDSYPTTNDLGIITDPDGGGTFNADTFTESGLVTGDPTFATGLLSRLVYSAPTLPNGQGFAAQASITVADGSSTATDATPVILGDVSAPAIGGTVANEPIASGNPIHPFATVNITGPYLGYYAYNYTGSTYTYGPDYYYNANDTATITITDGGKATDTDGLLTGPGLSKTGVGTYSLSATSSYSLETELNGLSFQTIAGVAAGQTVTPSFELDVTNSTSKLTTKDTKTSLLISGPPLSPVAPNIVGTVAGQIVAPGNVINPFSNVTVNDGNATPSDTATITLTGALSGTFAAATGLTETAIGSGIYMLAAASPATLTTELEQLTFIPAALAAGQTSETAGFTITATDVGNSLATTDKTSTVIEEAPPPPPPISGPNNPAPPTAPPPSDPKAPPTTTPITVLAPPITTPPATAHNFLVSDQTTGAGAYQSAGVPYSGPVAGLTSEIILATSDNINVSAEVANVFIKTGSGEDALNVGAVNGNNVLDGSTGSNFLVGGTGDDTFFLDDRSAPASIWDTVSGFHAGDAATIFGVTQAGFSFNWVNGQGAAGFTGLTLNVTAPGVPTASLTLPGYTTADLTNGKLSISYGTETDGTHYMYVLGH